MKKKTILGVALTLMLLGSLVAATAPAPVSAKTLGWSPYTIPSTHNHVIATGGNVTDIAVYDENVIYAGDGATYLYKTTNTGVGWSRLNVDATANNTDLVAVAPDDSDLIAYADVESDLVFVSDDGGTSWDQLAAITNLDKITDLAISAEKAGVHYVGVSGNMTTAAGNVWYYDIGATAPAWTGLNQLLGFSSTTLTDWCVAKQVGAIAFSPNFASDEVLVAIVENDDGDGGSAVDNVTLEMFSFDSKTWNTKAGFTGYPALILADNGLVKDGDPGLIAASVTLDPDYLGSDDGMRMAFVGLNLGGDSDAETKCGIYRADDTLTKAIKDGASLKMKSVAYNGLNLVAGRDDSNITYYCADPTATTPTVSPTSTYKRPGGVNNVAVAWAGDKVVAGTSGDESAFAVSKNDGKSYSDISLVDTELRILEDVGVTADGSVVYLLTNDETTTSNSTAKDLSVWREASSWERVLSVAINDTGTAYKSHIVRLAPDDPEVVYVAEFDGTAIYYSGDTGETRWQLRSCGVTIQDLAIETDGDVAYALCDDSGKVSKSTNSGFTWGLAKSTLLSSGNMIVSLGEDKLLVGSQNGYVSYSADGNDSWTDIAKYVVSGGTNVQCIASGVASGDFIYAAAKAEDYIYRWEIGESAVWDDIYTTALATAHVVTGFALQGKVLYALSANSTDSTAYRTTNATLSPTVYWSTMASTAEFDVVPQALRLAAGSNKLWAVNSEDHATTAWDSLYSYTDTLIDVGPTLNSPKQDFTLKVNPVTGKPYDVTFVWERPSDNIEAYQLKLAYDSGFDEEIASITKEESGSPISSVVGPGTVSFFEAPDETYVSGSIEFMPDTTYFWRVRVSSPIKSQYSEVRRFTVEKSEVTPPVTITIPPAPPAPEITVEVPPPTKIEIPPAPPAPAPITPAYIWAIIIIGAILVIALVILIVRTRRAV